MGSVMCGGRGGSLRLGRMLGPSRPWGLGLRLGGERRVSGAERGEQQSEGAVWGCADGAWQLPHSLGPRMTGSSACPCPLLGNEDGCALLTPSPRSQEAQTSIWSCGHFSD